MDKITLNSQSLRLFSQETLEAYGADTLQAESVADVLVWCDEIGRVNQGVWRLPIFCKRLSMGLVNTPCYPQLDKKTPTLALLDGDNGLGHHVARRGMEYAIEMAHENGVGIVTVRDSNFYGAGAYYVEQAARAGMISLALSNSFPKVVPFNGVEPVFGTNPFSFGAPMRNGESVLLDMATAASAGSAIRRSQETGEPLPEGVAIRSDGSYITDPNEVDQGALLPAAGAKGFGLAIMVEVLSGVISGAGIAHQVSSMYKNFDEPGKNGHFFFALDVKKMMDMEQYYQRMELVINYVKQVPGLQGELMYPGEKRWKYKKKSDALGVEIDVKTLERLEALAQEKSVFIPWL